jgi:hypothetical protein
MSSEFVNRIRFLAAGQDDPQSVALSDCADHIDALNAALEAYATETMERIDELEAALLRIVEWAESHGLYADEEAQLHPVFTEARAALEGKNE